ncbi:DsbA family protein [Deinococcus arcticus]|uniref:Disulfide bond formation protein DsbA n=1 Tax=Deinococcus arcticus TaxID=2136176 RepID=A0A2T3WBD7_9DEIO|nr:thioredoxin domain-containing protein [Deinococcus arcticus]PTA69053.1 disulfide bond formation protein DsbA [Deinococcus arcticus]
MTRLQGNNQNRTFLVVGTLVAAVLIALAVFAVQGKPAAGGALRGNFDLAGQAYIGQDSAPVNVVVVEDFKCPVCKTFEETVAPQLKEKYVDTGKIKQYSLIWPFLADTRGLPSDDSKFAAQAAKCVYDQGGNDAFASFKTIMFRAQGDEGQVWATKTRLKDLAANVEGLDGARFATCLDTDATAARVDADEQQVSSARVNATPTVFVNGQQVMTADGKVGSYAFEDISRAIDAASN